MSTPNADSGAAESKVVDLMRALEDSVNAAKAERRRRQEVEENCSLCGGNGCEYGCGHRYGGCQSAYLGPNSHRVCHKCKGTGRPRQNDGSGVTR